MIFWILFLILSGSQLDKSTIVKGKYECFYSYGTDGIDVGNTTVKCATIWVLESAGVRTFDEKGLFENRKGLCGHITQVAPSLTMLKNQDTEVSLIVFGCVGKTES